MEERDGGKRWTEESKQIYRARLKSCGGVVSVGVASVLRPLAEHAAVSKRDNNAQKGFPEITLRTDKDFERR